jgi:hypothetical protein
MKLSKLVIPLALFFAGCSSKIRFHTRNLYWGIDSSVYSIDDDGANFGGLSNSYGLDEKRIAIS